MKKRVTILLAFVGLFCLGVIVFPDSPTIKPSRLGKNLPEIFGDWTGRPEEPGEREKLVLAKDTEFERMNYHHGGGTRPSIQASIVFSGKNLSQSIHRPEVCLDAQGWTFVKESYLRFSGVLPGGEDLPVKEMICNRVIMRENDEGKLEPIILENGEKAHVWRAFYYTFFGHEKIVSGHYERTKEDIKDRIFKGHDQRWAYATFSSFITKRHFDQGIQSGPGDVLDEEETKAHVKSFLEELLPLVVAPPGEGYDEALETGKNLGS
ncbi:EpsI family protein [bacterium]|nr:EpsI family protein [bacterium]MDB4754428.1 EpsI family protein [Akkermansiaceae bacterium]